jgi:hypothetical protein
MPVHAWPRSGARRKRYVAQRVCRWHPGVRFAVGARWATAEFPRSLPRSSWSARRGRASRLAVKALVASHRGQAGLEPGGPLCRQGELVSPGFEPGPTARGIFRARQAVRTIPCHDPPPPPRTDEPCPHVGTRRADRRDALEIEGGRTRVAVVVRFRPLGTERAKEHREGGAGCEEIRGVGGSHSFTSAPPASILSAGLVNRMVQN